MTVARHPLHRSGHAELPHPAPASGCNAESLIGPRVIDAWFGKPTINKPPLPLQFKPRLLAASLKYTTPEFAYKGSEDLQRRVVSRHSIIPIVPLNYRAQICALLGDRKMHASLHLS
jgi:hypothetical protein